MFFLEYISDDRVPRRKVLHADKDAEMSAEAPECRKLGNRWAGMIFLLLPTN